MREKNGREKKEKKKVVAAITIGNEHEKKNPRKVMDGRTDRTSYRVCVPALVARKKTRKMRTGETSDKHPLFCMKVP